MLKVKSSWVKEIGYVKGNLQIRLKNGSNYIYLDVPQRKFNYIANLEGDSVGRAINVLIKPEHRCISLSPEK